jgi:hypothetical protein
MRNKVFAHRFLLASSLCLATSLSVADVLKCRDAAGGISYTDGVCNENTQLERVVINGNTLSQKTSKQTVWANRQFAYRSQPDVESIRIARLKVLSMDREHTSQR